MNSIATNTLGNKFNHKYIHYAVVKFQMGFPFDMLRYDRCAPAREGDSSVMDARKGTLVVQKYSEDKDWAKAWTPARWKTFQAELTEPFNLLPEPETMEDK